jgi:quinoprotein glucose dehydrogenase
LVDLVADRNARVAYSAMLAIGKQRVTAAGAAVLERLNANADADPILRHGAIMAIAGIDDEALWMAVRQHSSPAVRLAGVVAGRKAQRPGMADWLKDGDLRVVTEAARAIYDTPLLAELPKLAAYLPLAGGDDGLARRAIQANDFLAQAENAERLAAFAAAPGGSIERRVEALQVLAQWDQPRPLEAVMNDYRPRPLGRASDAVAAIRQALPALLTAEADVATKTSEVAAGLGLAEVAPILRACFEDPQQSGTRRAAALRSWVGLQGKEILSVIRAAGLDPAVEVRAAALESLAEVAPESAAIAFDVALRGELREQQAALRSVGRLPNDAQTALLRLAVAERAAGRLPRGAELELLEALELPAAAGLLEQWQREGGEAEATTVGQRFPELLQGGDVARGRRVFFEKTAVSCVRCHAVQGVGGAVGPELSGIGAQKDRAYLLEAILEPNAAIATGFETQLILDLEGVTHLGIVKAETDEYVELMDADGRLVRIPQDDIEERRRGQSSMPDGMDEKLSRHEIRDLVEYLASLSAAKTEQ